MPSFSINAAKRRASAPPREADFYENPYGFYAEIHAQAPSFVWDNYGH